MLSLQPLQPLCLLGVAKAFPSNHSLDSRQKHEVPPLSPFSQKENRQENQKENQLENQKENQLENQKENQKEIQKAGQKRTQKGYQKENQRAGNTWAAVAAKSKKKGNDGK
ncbi:hypothetical protein PGQ11_001955 [Apiospora arundinis]|uniref:Secreted protein n=1 Tax=Apiospora arundinis TaxID=335852 RepID=A0ABR2JGQ1_9PEZI